MLLSKTNTIPILLCTILVLGVTSTQSHGQQSIKSQEIQKRERIIDMRFETWLESKQYIHQLEDICDEYSALGRWKKIESLVAKAELPKPDANDIYQNAALHIAKQLSVSEAIAYLDKHIVKVSESEDRTETIANNVGEIATRLAYKGDIRSLKMLEGIPWSKQLVIWRQGTSADIARQRHLVSTAGWLAAVGRLNEALGAVEAIADPKGKDELNAEIFSKATGVASHSELLAIYDQIKSPRVKGRAIHSGFRSARSLRYRTKIDKADLLLAFCDEFGQQDPKGALMLVAPMCEKNLKQADRHRAFQIAKEMFSLIPKDQRKDKYKKTICKCHIRIGEFKRAIELATSLQLEENFLLRSYFSLFSEGDVAKRIVKECNAEQIVEIVDAFPNQYGDKLEFVAHLLECAADNRANAKVDVIVGKLLAIKHLTPGKFRLDECRYTLNGALARMLEVKGNTQLAINLVTHINRKLKRLSPNEFWARVAIPAYRHGQVKEFEFCLDQIEPSKRWQIQLRAVFGSNDRKQTLHQIDDFLSDDINSPESPTMAKRVDLMQSMLAQSFMSWKSEDRDLSLEIWAKISKKLTKAENQRMIGFASVTIRNSTVKNSKACLAYLERIEELGGPDPRIQIARCNANLYAGNPEVAKEIFTELVESGAVLIESDYMVFLEKFAVAKIYDPLELCLEKNIDGAVETALKHLSHRLLEQGDHAGAVKLAEKLVSPSKREEYLRELSRVLKTKNMDAQSKGKK